MENTKDVIMGEITALKSLLADSDYAFFKTVERLMACTSSTAMINVLKTGQDERGELATRRQSWRDRINVLEVQYAALEGNGE